MDRQEKLPFLPDEDSHTREIQGLSYAHNFIDAATHDHLIESIDEQPWEHWLKRRVQQYGYRYDYKNRRIDESHWLGPLPDWADSAEALLHRPDIFEAGADQLIVNEYLPGQGISPHVDRTTCFGGTIAILSLASQLVMDFVCAHSGQRHQQMLESRSLLVLKGPARCEWKHGIAARKTDRFKGESHRRKRRISLTFRKVLIDT